ncbi:recombination protein RecR [Desulfobulbus rhabdoformis]|uniref:recombination mediator RecR n=1 Tax=Desulfobulbus rhabdoformis TaxID=34032 RepID=UPI0019641530|nr:recombination mediator RecR [Desulfobulbus rhabdoformis]MBM9613933.1 recombination protein RecR [Desulfobulbus rhabdoformis]
MQVIPPALDRLITDLTKLPGIGRKTATRLALYILRHPASEAKNLAMDLGQLHETIHLCSGCYTFSETDPCAICGNPSRNSRIVCVVEEPGDQIAVEKTGAFSGTYHILHGVIAPMDGIGPSELKMEELRKRVQSGQVDEVLIATSSTVAGEATASYIAEMLANTGIGLSRLACGIPMGMDIKYADEHTLARAIQSRQSVSLNP